MKVRTPPWLLVSLGLLVGCSASQGNEPLNDAASTSDVAYLSDAASTSDVAYLSDAASTSDVGVVEEPVHVLLADNAAWVLETASTDPFPLASDGVRCDEEAVLVEEVALGLWYDIQTDHCDHATIHQTTLVDLNVGDTLLVWIWHYAMDHEGGDFHSKLSFGDPSSVIWETSLPVPAISGLIYEEMTVTEPWPAGTSIWFHLSNHGVNTWSLVEFARID